MTRTCFRPFATALTVSTRGIPADDFLLFHRERVWSETEQQYIGRERKRGKIEELNDFLAGGKPDSIVNVGALPLPIRYVITLDADTQFPLDLRAQVGGNHRASLNRVEIDAATRMRAQWLLRSFSRASASGCRARSRPRFTRVFADTAGTDPYCQTVSDAQQDLFGEAIFHGKAIYDCAGVPDDAVSVVFRRKRCSVTI